MAGVVMGRCAQARFQLHSARVTSCTHGAAHTAWHASPPARRTHCSHPGHTHAESARSLPQTHMPKRPLALIHRQPLPPCPPLPSPGPQPGPGS